VKVVVERRAAATDSPRCGSRQFGYGGQECSSTCPTRSAPSGGVAVSSDPLGLVGLLTWAEDPDVEASKVWDAELDALGAREPEPILRKHELMNTIDKIARLLSDAGLVTDRLCSSDSSTPGMSRACSRCTLDSGARSASLTLSSAQLAPRFLNGYECSCPGSRRRLSGTGGQLRAVWPGVRPDRRTYAGGRR
jgi:hypothetical protein